MATRAGIGYDIHRFAPGRALRVGGLAFPGEAGLEGHSDADVALHAIADALLGGAGLGDIGDHFPPTDEQWRDADSGELLGTVVALIVPRFVIVNVDLTVVGERPRIAPRRAEMRLRVAALLGVDELRVNIKATTHEGLGALGRGEGLAALAVAALEEREQRCGH